MKRLVLLVFVALLGFTTWANTERKQVNAIQKVIENAYLKGTQNVGDMDLIDAGFHNSFRMQVLEEDGNITNVDIDSWKQMVNENIEKGILPRPKDKQVSVDYLGINVEKYAATVKLRYILEGKPVYMDYMQLYKFPDGWKIVNKIYRTVDE